MAVPVSEFQRCRTCRSQTVGGLADPGRAGMCGPQASSLVLKAFQPAKVQAARPDTNEFCRLSQSRSGALLASVRKQSLQRRHRAFGDSGPRSNPQSARGTPSPSIPPHNLRRSLTRIPTSTSISAPASSCSLTSSGATWPRKGFRATLSRNVRVTRPPLERARTAMRRPSKRSSIDRQAVVRRHC